MAEPVNLNRFRKEKARAEKKARANENATRFGRSKAQKEREAAERAKAKGVLDGAKKEP